MREREHGWGVVEGSVRLVVLADHFIFFLFLASVMQTWRASPSNNSVPGWKSLSSAFFVNLQELPTQIMVRSTSLVWCVLAADGVNPLILFHRSEMCVYVYSVQWCTSPVRWMLFLSRSHMEGK